MGRPIKVVTEQGDEVAQTVDLDLDALKREAAAEPFSFRLGGERFTMASPEDADWQVGTSVSDEDPQSLHTLLKELLGDPAYARFVKHRLAGWKLGRLIQSCTEHYGITPGESRASRRSSKRTAGR